MIVDGTSPGRYKLLYHDSFWRCGPRFPAKSEIYTHKLRDLARQAGKELDLTKYLKEGVYAMNGGPSFETVAECKMLQAVGADVVGKESTQVFDGV